MFSPVKYSMKDETIKTIKEFKLTREDVEKAKYNHFYDTIEYNKKIANNYLEYKYLHQKFK